MNRRIVRWTILTAVPLTLNIVHPDPLRFLSPFAVTVNRFGPTTHIPRRTFALAARMARLPRAPSQNELFVVEVGVDRTTFAIESVHVNPPFGGLRQLLESTLLGQPISRAAEAGQEAIDGAYFSPYRSAVKAALLEVTEAFERFQKSRAFPRVRADWEG